MNEQTAPYQDKIDMKEIAIYGAGGLGREVAAMIDNINHKTPTWKFIGFFDDGVETGTAISHFGTVLGGQDTLNSWQTPLSVVVCMGNPRTLQKIVDGIDNDMLDFPNLLSPDFVVEDSETFIMGKGNIVKSNCRFTCNATVGDFNIINGSVGFGHNVTIGNCNVFMPGTRISGETEIGNRNLFGSMSFVKQCLRIGNDITLSPLSPLLTRPKDGHTYMGNPAKILKF